MYLIKYAYVIYSHYGASRLCEAASRQDVHGLLRSLEWVSDKRGSLRSLRSEVLLQTFMQKSLSFLNWQLHMEQPQRLPKVGTLLRP